MSNLALLSRPELVAAERGPCEHFYPASRHIVRTRVRMGSPEQERNKAERNRMTHRLTNVLMWRGEFLVKQPPPFLQLQWWRNPKCVPSIDPSAESSQPRRLETSNGEICRDIRAGFGRRGIHDESLFERASPFDHGTDCDHAAFCRCGEGNISEPPYLIDSNGAIGAPFRQNAPWI